MSKMFKKEAKLQSFRTLFPQMILEVYKFAIFCWSSRETPWKHDRVVIITSNSCKQACTLYFIFYKYIFTGVINKAMTSHSSDSPKKSSMQQSTIQTAETIFI
jgi:Leu/Phe-tRNA-protein transferase